MFDLSLLELLQNDSELFGRTIRVNLAKPQRIKEGSTRPVWSEDTWLQQHAGETIGKTVGGDSESKDTEEKVKKLFILICTWFLFLIFRRVMTALIRKKLKIHKFTLISKLARRKLEE